MRFIKALLSLIVTSGIIYIMHFGIGQIPALGKFLNPFTGFWTNSELKAGLNAESNKTIPLTGTKDEVVIKYDENGVPHIFANNDYDLYFAQGFVTAKDRLWQMEFQTHFAAGRISEIVGERGAESDAYQRRMGAVYGAEQSLAGMMEIPECKTALEGYSDGINAYIASLSESNLPVEYKLLGYKPEPWQPIKSALFLKNMAFVLAAGSDELQLTNVANKYGLATAEELFPNYPKLESPVIPDGTPLDFSPLPLPKAPKDFVGQATAKTPAEQNRNLGSNNWAVAGTKSASGMPILANDPHLALNLPSIWYQMQLHAPGVNVYGSTMPGSPNIIIGFNKDIAWGVTNVGADILDWYQVKFKDANKEQYWHDNQWKPVKKRIEVIKIKGMPDKIDTVLYTHHGPVVYTEPMKPFKNFVPVGHALRWVAHEKSQELATFYRLNRAKNYDDYVKALSFYSSPAQNFIFASNQNDIALWVNGKYPLKARTQGKYILDGTDADADWKDYIPHAHNPHVKNPERGFVSSANQSSVNPDYPYYINWEFTASERGRRINQRLERMNSATIDSLRSLQNDNYNLRAADVLPSLLAKVGNGNAKTAPVVKLLKSWNLENGPNQVGATIFEEWMKAINVAIWKDELNNDGDDATMPMRFPAMDKTIDLLRNDSTSRWFDNITTKDKKEIANDIVTASLEAAIDTLTKHKGPVPAKWLWYDWKQTSIKHLLGANNAAFDKFNHNNINIGGGGHIVNAASNRWGPSWRMIVQLDATGNPVAKGLFPGGQSGNPGSALYDNMIDAWSKGELNDLLYLKSKNETSDRIKKVLVFKSK